MSKVKKRISKPLVIILCVIFAIALIAMASLIFLYAYSTSIEKKQTEIISNFSASIDINGETVTINSWQNSKDNKDYLFLPSDADTSNITLHCDNATTMTIDNESYALDEPTDALSNMGEYEIKFDNEKYNVVVMKSDNLPSVHINTTDASLEDIYADKDLKVSSSISIFYNGEEILNDELKYFKGRGNASWDFAQKSFNIKFNEKTDLFDMGKAKKYSLITTYVDQSLIKNDVAYSLASDIGLDYTPQYQQVDLYVNDNYLGNYLIVSSVEISKNRININDLEKATEEANPDVDFDEVEILTTDNSLQDANSSTIRWADIENNPEDITSGYLLEIELANRYVDEPSGFVTSNGQTIVVKSPEYATKEEVEYISSFYQEFEDALYSDDGYNELGKSYLDYIDGDTFAKIYLIQELSNNKDANITSTYMYLDSSGKLKAGPAWDFDNSFGSQVFLGNLKSSTNFEMNFKVCFSAFSSSTDGIFNLLVKHNDFRQIVYEIWSDEFRETALDSLNLIDNIRYELTSSAVMNGIRWNRYCTTNIDENVESYNEACDDLVDLINSKIELFDSQITDYSAVLYYSSNGEATNSSGVYSLIGSEITVINNLYSSNKKFISWNTEADGSGTTYNPGDTIILSDETITLYAQWSDNDSVKIKVVNTVNNLYSKIKNSLIYRYKVIAG
jgi:hypothetical protein